MNLTESKLQVPSSALAQSLDGLRGGVTEVREVREDASIFHGFRVGSLGLILPKTIISELVEDLSICRVPNTNPIFHGVGSLRGSIVPVFDLQRLFGMESSEHPYVIVIGSGDDSVAVLLDEIPQQIKLDVTDRFTNIPPLPDVIKPFVDRVYRKDGLWVDCRIFEFFKSIRPLITH